MRPDNCTDQTPLYSLLPNLAEAVGTPYFAKRLMQVLHETTGADKCAVFLLHFMERRWHVPIRRLGSGSLRAPGQIECVLAQSIEESTAFQSSVALYVDCYSDRPRRMSAKYVPVASSVIDCYRTVIAEVESERFRREFYYAANLVDHVWSRARYGNAVLSLNAFRSGIDGVLRVTRFAELLPMLIPLITFDLDFKRGPPGFSGKLVPPQAETLIAALGTKLSERERQVCARIICGLTSDGIASDLGVSLHTVCTLRRRAYAKLNINSVSELFTLAIETPSTL